MCTSVLQLNTGTTFDAQRLPKLQITQLLTESNARAGGGEWTELGSPEDRR